MGAPRSIVHDVVTFDTYRPWKDSDHLRELYHTRGMSQREMARAMSCSRQTVFDWMKRYDIPRRSVGEHQTPSELRDGAWVRRQHHELGKSVPEIAETVGCSGNAVRNALSRHDIDLRSKYVLNDRTKEMLESEETLRYLYFDRDLSQSEIAQRVGCQQMAVSNRFNKFDIQPKPQGWHQIGEDNHNWLPPEEMADPRGYGSVEWRKKRKECLEKYDNRCLRCDITTDEHKSEHGFGLDAHHIRPADEFDSREEADRIDNLVALCRSCHNKLEGFPIDARTDR